MKLIGRGNCSKVNRKGSSVPLQPRLKFAANVEGAAGSNSRQVVPDDIPLGAAGYASSREEIFFEACPWLESDCEDDFFSVNGDLTPARSFRTASSSSNHGAVAAPPAGPRKLPTLGSILRAEALKHQQQQQPPPQKRLADLLRERQESFAHDHHLAGGVVSRNSSSRAGEQASRCCMPGFARGGVSYRGRRKLRR